MEIRPIDANALKQSLDIAPDEWAKGRTVHGYIDEAPTVDYAPIVHARWQDVGLNFMLSYMCSNCRKMALMSTDDMNLYRPNCGAKMDGGKENV